MGTEMGKFSRYHLGTSLRGYSVVGSSFTNAAPGWGLAGSGRRPSEVLHVS